MNHNIYIIVATDESLGIGKDGKLPWHLKDELKYFKDITTKTDDHTKHNMVVMGRTTWESIPPKHRPLPNRRNVVLSRNTDYEAVGAETIHTLEGALLVADNTIENIFVIGGAQVFKAMMERDDLTGIYLTQIHDEYDCDTFFPEIPESFGEPQNLGGVENDEVSYNYLFYGSK